MSEIHVKDGESIDSALKRFKRSCAKGWCHRGGSEERAL